MIRLLWAIVISLVVALAATWLITLPGTVDISAFGYRMRPGLGLVLFLLALTIIASILIWAVIRRIFGIPALFSRAAQRQRNRKGLEALSDAIIAFHAGDPARARALARDARSRLDDVPGAELLEARALVEMGALSEARERYRDLIDNPATAVAALSGLHEQARLQGREKAALVFARKAVAIDPGLGWASDAVFAQLTKAGNWSEALEMERGRPTPNREERSASRRRQAVLMTAIARDAEDTDTASAMENARAALKLEPDFVPAALIAARLYINQGETRKAAGLLRRVWRDTAHPQIAELFAHAQPGASAVERFKRTRSLIEDPAAGPEAAAAYARGAIDAHEWAEARKALTGFIETEPTQRLCLLMAEIEEGETGDQGKARAWLSRAVKAPRDPVWTADGITSDEWEPTSPITGRLDAFAWKVPVAALAGRNHNGTPGAAPHPAATPSLPPANTATGAAPATTTTGADKAVDAAAQTGKDAKAVDRG